MKVFKYFKLLSIATALSLAACGGGDSPEPNNPDNPDDPDSKNEVDSTSVQIYAQIKDLTNSSSNTNWNASDAIGVTVTSTYSGLTKGTNVKYYRKDDKFTSDTPIFIKKLKNSDNKEVVTFSAYYPFHGTNGTAAGTISNVTTEDQSKQASFDFMFASGAQGALRNSTINFTDAAAFRHCMSQVTLIFKEGDNVSLPRNLISYKVKRLIMEGTFNTTNGEAKANSKAKAKDLIIPLTVTTDKMKDGQYTASPIILYPQEVADGKITVEISFYGQTSTTTLTLPSSQKNQLEAGYNLNYTITLSRSKVSIGTPTITNWKEADEIDGIARPE